MIDEIKQALSLLSQKLNNVADALKSKPDVYYGTVASVSGSTANVTLDGDTQPVSASLQCNATENDRVTVIRNGTTLTAVSKIGGDHVELPRTYYGTCGTGASTAAKSVTCSGFKLKTGSVVCIYFSAANTANTPTLNINSTGAIGLRVGNTAASGTANVLKFSAYTLLTVVYDGTYYQLVSIVQRAANNQGGAAWYGTCSTAAATAAKTSTITNFKLTPGALVTISFAYGNTAASPTLNVNSTGAKNIYKLYDQGSSEYVAASWDANDVLTLMYSGSNWYVVSIVKCQDNEVMLFDDDSSTSTTVTLSETAANFEKLVICYTCNDGQYNSVEIVHPDGKKAQLFASTYTSSADFYGKTCTVLISGTSIAQSGFAGQFTVPGGTASTANDFYITQVIGYRG